MFKVVFYKLRDGAGEALYDTPQRCGEGQEYGTQDAAQDATQDALKLLSEPWDYAATITDDNGNVVNGWNSSLIEGRV